MSYFDNSATTYPKPEIFAQFADIVQECGVNGSRGKYKKASMMKEIEDELHATLASDLFFNIYDKRKIVWTSSATVAINQVLQGLDYSKIKTVYISPFEHNAVYRTILYLQKQYDFDLEIIPFDIFEWKENKTAMFFNSKNPDLVILNHASNVFGNILPVEKIFSLAKNFKAITVLDVAQTAGTISVDMKNLNIDFACFAGHKGLYGPSGIGGFAINADIQLRPILFGGTGINSEEVDMPISIPERFEVGSMNSWGIIGLNLSVKWIKETGIAQIAKRKNENLEKLRSVLSEYDEIKILAQFANNIGVISTIFDGYTPQDMATFLNENDIAVREGLHCAPLAHKHIGTAPNGTVRFSVGYFNNDDDFAQLADALDEIL